MTGRHVIVGAGNLGLDIRAEIERQGAGFGAIFSRSNGLDVRDGEAVARLVEHAEFNTLWYCVGAGGVGGARDSPELAEELLVTAPIKILRSAPKHARLVFFTSDHCAAEEFPDTPPMATTRPRSEYARLQLRLEKAVISSGRPNVTVVRMSALYGYHKPLATLPGKILSRFGFRDVAIRLPLNLVTPTPTLWAAARMIQCQEKLFDARGPVFHHVAPAGNVSVRDWATFILKGLRPATAFLRSKEFDETAPQFSELGCSLTRPTPHWYDVWTHYFRQSWFTPRELRSQLPGTASEGARGTPAS